MPLMYDKNINNRVRVYMENAGDLPNISARYFKLCFSCRNPILYTNSSRRQYVRLVSIIWCSNIGVCKNFNNLQNLPLLYSCSDLITEILLHKLFYSLLKIKYPSPYQCNAYSIYQLHIWFVGVWFYYTVYVHIVIAFLDY